MGNKEIIWKLKPKVPEKFINKSPKYSRLTLQLLYNRGLKKEKEIEKFFKPDYEKGLYNPFLMKGMRGAVKRILKAVSCQERIVVFGDYDVDGVCATVLLVKLLKELGSEFIDIYIPGREKEGYGLNLEAVKKLAKEKTDLIITVDCGVSDFEEVKFAGQLGIEVLILDHHLLPPQVPPAKVIVNPHQSKDKYPFKLLSGTGVVFKLIQAMPKVSERFEKWLLDLVALATIADSMPLLDENRVLVHFGLLVLNKTKNKGLLELMKSAGLKRDSLDVSSLDYTLIPRLNAAGRMDHATVSYELLMLKNESKLKELARRLNSENQRRQNLVTKIMEEAEKKLSKSGFGKIIFEGSTHWPIGVLGLVASKLREKYHCPTFIFGSRNDNFVGSGRSIPGLNIAKEITKYREMLLEYGGHSQAAGFTVAKKRFKKFKRRIVKSIKKKLAKKITRPFIEIEAEIKPADISWSLLKEIEKFSPFGKGNLYPKFLARALIVKDSRVVGRDGKHLKLTLGSPSLNYNLKAIAFGLGEKFEKMRIGEQVDVIFEVSRDDWNGEPELQLKVLDLKRNE